MLQCDEFAVDEISEDKVRYCERFIELLIDLESQLLTRRFFNTVLDDAHVLVRSRLSALSRRQDDDGSDGCGGKLFRQLIDVLSLYATFEINEETGEARTDSEMTAIHYDEITSLQVVYIGLRSNNSSITTRTAFADQNHFSAFFRALKNNFKIFRTFKKFPGGMVILPRRISGNCCCCRFLHAGCPSPLPTNNVIAFWGTCCI